MTRRFGISCERLRTRNRTNNSHSDKIQDMPRESCNQKAYTTFCSVCRRAGHSGRGVSVTTSLTPSKLALLPCSTTCPTLLARSKNPQPVHPDSL
jgi:hypothetical protein